MNTRKTRRFCPPALEALEGRVALSLGVSGTLVASEVARLHLSRAEVGQVLARQFRSAYSQFATDLQAGLDAVAAGGDVATFQASLNGLLDTLSQELLEPLSTSRRAAGSLNAAVEDAIVSNGANSLRTRLRAQILPPESYDDLTALGQTLRGTVLASQRANIARLATFARQPGFDFTGADFEARQGPSSIAPTTSPAARTTAATTTPTATTAAVRSSVIQPLLESAPTPGSTLTFAQRRALRLGYLLSS